VAEGDAGKAAIGAAVRKRVLLCFGDLEARIPRHTGQADLLASKTAPAPIKAAHVTGGFGCGISSLDQRLCRQALENEASGAPRTLAVCFGPAMFPGRWGACPRIIGRRQKILPSACFCSFQFAFKLSLIVVCL